ncbi:MAG TPA: clostripain-related cysteine peptidase [Anaerolineales bacterium]|nr:clostripain-related cysteine peptidase [Anaerolineales bacterium]
MTMQKTTCSFIVFISLFVLLLTLSCTSVATPPARAKWTIMIYLSGDNDLENYVVQDMESELAAVGSSTNIQIIALADRGPGYDTSRGDWQTTKLFRVTQGMTATPENALADWGERNFGDPQTLIDFVTWTKANYPADRYALYFWGHGWNWHPGYVMQDDTDSDTLDMEEVKAALPSIGFIDMVGFDGCNMASIEVQLFWRGYATALTHSQEWVGWEGVQYDLVLAQLAANPNMSADQLAIATSQSASSDKTWSAVAVDSRFDALLTAVDQWSVALKNGLGQNRKKYDQAFTATRTFWQAPMDKDLYDMAYEMDRLVSDANIKSKSQAVMDAVDAVVLHERHVNAYADANGITIYHISKAVQKDSDYTYYRTLDFALQTGWDEFLDMYAK